MDSETQRNLKYRFIFSGDSVEDSVEKVEYYKQCVRKLGGTFINCSNDQFIATCTHVISFTFKSSVKIMGGLAAGKWLVTKEFLEDSIAMQKFLPEEKYEVPDHDHVARHCRKMGGQLYRGCIIYLETKSNERSYKRVFVAGGANVLNKEEVEKYQIKLHYAFCDAQTYASVKKLLSNRPAVPILNLEYMRQTVFFKHNPKDVRKFLVNKNQKIAITNFVGNKENAKLMEVKEFVKASLQSTPRIIRRTNAQQLRLPSSGQRSIVPFLLQPIGSYNQQNKQAKKIRTDPIDANDDIEIIGEFTSSSKTKTQFCSVTYSSIVNKTFKENKIPTSKTVVSLISHKLLPNQKSQLKENNMVINRQPDASSNWTPVEVKDKISPLKNSFTNDVDVIPAQWTKHDPTESFINMHVEVNTIGSSKKDKAFDCKVDSEFLLKESKSSVINSKEVSCTIASHVASKINHDSSPMEATTIQMTHSEQLIENNQNVSQNNFKDNSKAKIIASSIALPIDNEMQLTTADNIQKMLVAPQVEINNLIITKDIKENLKLSAREICLQNKAALLKAGTYTIPLEFETLIATLRNFLIKLNTSYFMLLNNMLTIPKFVPLVVKKDHKSNNLPNSTVVKPLELRSVDTILHNTIFDFKNLKICSQKVGRNIIKVAKQHNKVYDEEDALIALCYLQWLRCQLQKTCFPNAKVIGDMIKLYILKFPFENIRNQALNIFGELLSLHPPHSVALRTYYINVFSEASSEEVYIDSNRCWGFIRIIIEDVLAKSSKSLDEPSLTLLSNIIHMLELDLIYYNDRPVSINYLICYRLFWPLKRENPSVVNGAVKDLLRLWMESLLSFNIATHLLTRLICILLEMLWKWSEFSNPLLLADWPLNSKWMPVINEILIKYRACDDLSQLLKVLKFVETPWQRLLLSTLMFRVVQPNFKKASLSKTKDFIRKYVYECADKKISVTSGTLHQTIMEVLAIMFISYVDSSGHTFCKEDICQKFTNSLKKEIINCSDTKKEEISEKLLDFHNNLNSDECSASRGSKRKHFDNGSHSQSTSSKIHQLVEENISNESTFITKEMVENMLDVFHRLPYYTKSFEGYKKKCPHVIDSLLVNNL